VECSARLQQEHVEIGQEEGVGVYLGVYQLSRKPVDTTGSGATTSAIGAMTSRAGKSTLGGGFGMSPELIVAGVIS
ncbi:hypothetical protein Tco_0167504, partial [Tanacetum coccineum]